MRIAVGLAALLLLTAPAAAADLDAIIAHTDAMLAAPGGGLACFPSIAGPADVFAVGVYEGNAYLGRSQNGHPPRAASIHIAATARPVLVIATAYEPVVWTFTLDPGARLAGVMLSGYYEQMVDGLPDGTPLGRSYFREHTEQPPKACGSSLSPALADLVRREIGSERQAQSNLARRTDALLARAADYDAFLAALRKSGATADMLALAQPIVDAADMDAQAARDDQQALRATIDSFETMLSGRAATSILPESGYFNVGDGFDPADLDARLQHAGLSHIVSVQYQYTAPDTPFEVSDAIAAAYAAGKADAAQRLASLTPPSMALLPADAPRLAPPLDLDPRAGLQYLIDKGYAVPSLDYTKYVCDLRSAVLQAAGRIGNPCEDVYQPYLVLLGPVTFPEGLYGADRGLFILPDGVPEPEGDRGHSVVIHPARIRLGQDMSDF